MMKQIVLFKVVQDDVGLLGEKKTSEVESYARHIERVGGFFFVLIGYFALLYA